MNNSINDPDEFIRIISMKRTRVMTRIFLSLEKLKHAEGPIYLPFVRSLNHLKAIYATKQTKNGIVALPLSITRFIPCFL